MAWLFFCDHGIIVPSNRWPGTAQVHGGPPVRCGAAADGVYPERYSIFIYVPEMRCIGGALLARNLYCTLLMITNKEFNFLLQLVTA